jgi:4-amino-4-deoxy-L-arabinose transferase-like glycosyltransferase
MDDPLERIKALVLLVLILFIALVLRVPNLYTIPHWFWDEGINLNYGWNLSEGRIQWFSIKYSFIPHPPLYLMALALLVKLSGISIIAARFLSVLYSIPTLILLYLTAVEVSDRKTGLIAAALYAIYPAAVYWSRTAMINNQLSVLVMLSLYSFIRHVKVGGSWWFLACVTAVAASLTAYMSLVLIASLSLYFLVKEPEKLGKAFFTMVGTLIFFVLFMLYLRGNYFIEDMVYQLERFNLLGLKTIFMILAFIVFVAYFKRLKPFLSNLLETEVEVMFESREYFNEVFVPSCLLAINFILAYTLITPFSDKSIFTGGDYFWFGIIGLLFISKFIVHVVLLYFLPLFAATILLGRSDHMLIQVYPFFTLGVAVLILEFKRFMLRITKRFKIPAASILVVLILALPFAFTLYYDVRAFTLGGVLRKEPASYSVDAAVYVNSVARPGELVLTTSNMAGLIETQSTVITQAFVYEGRGIGYYRSNLSADWFVHNCSIGNAAYIVVPPGALKWFEEIDHGDIVAEIGKWPIVYRNPGYAVYRNPSLYD